MLNQDLRDFIHVALGVEVAPDPQAIRNSIRGGSVQHREVVETGLRELLRTRELTTLDWIKLTYVEFHSEEELYGYLQKMYDYLFRDAEELPEIPEG